MWPADDDHELAVSTATFVSRAQWGARPPHGAYTPRALTDVDTVFVHYSDTHESIPPPGTASDAATVRAIQAHHLATGYVDIAYEALIGGNGSIFVGRPNDVWDASTCHNNRNGAGICVLSDGPITPAQERSVQFLVGLCRLKFPNVARTPRPHSSACATACPGNTIRAWMASVNW